VPAGSEIDAIGNKAHPGGQIESQNVLTVFAMRFI